MSNSLPFSRFVGGRIRLLPIIAILFSFILANPFIGFSAESSHLAIIAVPLVMTNPILPTQFLFADNAPVKDETTVVIGCGSDGAALLIRVSGRD